MQGTLTRGDGRKNAWSEQEIDDQLTAAFGNKKDDIVAQFKHVFPRKKVQDALYYAGGSRPGVKNLLARKLEKARAPVYNYLFAWEYAINGGINVIPLLRARVLLPRPERAADPHRDRRWCGRDVTAGQSGAGVGQLRANGQSQPARTGMEALHEGELARDGVRHHQRVGSARRRSAGVASAGWWRSRCPDSNDSRRGRRRRASLIEIRARCACASRGRRRGARIAGECNLERGLPS